jgi:hypothetical protein
MNSRMKQKHRLSVVLVLGGIVLVTMQFATAQMAGTGSRRSMMRGPLYDPATEITVKGAVSEIQQLTGKPMGTATGTIWGNCPGEWTGTHLSITTDQGSTLIVHVGPTAFLTEKNFSLVKGDKLTIVGSKMQYKGSDFLIAREITKGDQVLKLRDSEGFPEWSGPARRGTMPNPPEAK